MFSSSIVVEPGETQRIRGHVADAAETGGKTVYKTILLQRLANQRANSILLAPVESMFA